ncbi:MAG: aminotransferase class V-fold PLP-dependent enzyme [Planctomycetota bacterium]|nr:aminotransferase class V-fold PLP-dependent enzyme [Planctomycetota bacterium]
MSIVDRCWRDSRHPFTCLSVRSGFDILLQALNLPAGSEVIVSAMTIDGILKILEKHHLVAVPVDLEFDTLAPAVQDVAEAVTDKTRLILIAHLFGTQVDMEPYAEIAHQHGIRLVEDCAQSFRGMPHGQRDVSDIAMYSFGPIKTGTALGGAVLSVADRTLIKDMQQIQENYPRQSRSFFAKRVIKYCFLKAISYRFPFRLFLFAMKILGKNYNRILKNSVRGFASDELFKRLRQQPSAPLLHLLRRRLGHFDRQRLQHQIDLGELLVDHLSHQFQLPGIQTLTHHFWVFPVLTDNPQVLIEHLRKKGFDTDQRGSMVVVESSSDRQTRLTPTTHRILDKAVFVPLYPAMSRRTINRLARAICHVAATKTPHPTTPFPVNDACVHTAPESLAQDT